MGVWQERPRCDEAPAWALLTAHFRQAFEGPQAFDLRRAFAQDAGRFAAFSLEAPPLFADLSKNLIDRTAQRLLTQLARECRVEAHRDAMLRGERINVSEDRPVTHVHWRSESNPALAPTDHAPSAIKNIVDVPPQVQASRR